MSQYTPALLAAVMVQNWLESRQGLPAALVAGTL